MNLGKIYIELAEKDLKSGNVKGAVAALESLAQILTELSVEDRQTLAKSYPELQREAEKTAIHSASNGIAISRFARIFKTTPL